MQKSQQRDGATYDDLGATRNVQASCDADWFYKKPPTLMLWTNKRLTARPRRLRMLEHARGHIDLNQVMACRSPTPNRPRGQSLMARLGIDSRLLFGGSFVRTDRSFR